VQGDRDELCPLRDLKVAYGRMREPKDLVVIEGADHLFDGHTNAVAGAVEDLLGDFRAGTGDRGPGTVRTNPQSLIPNPQGTVRRS
jgi:alpha/beta superfamily hydrolase